MSDDKAPTDLNRVKAEKGREEADLREEADHVAVPKSTARWRNRCW